jgi:hypothetical protein
VRLESASIVSLLVILFALFSCREKSDQDLISALLDQTIAAANERSAGKIVEHATEDFKGPSGADVKDCRRILTGYFFGKGWLKVFEQTREIVVDGSTAKAKLDVIIAVGNEVQKLEDLIPTNGTHLLFDVDLEKISGEWKYKRATYKHVR